MNKLLEVSLSELVIIHALQKKHKYIVQGRNPNSLMALGALEVHLKMAIQAQKASESE